MTGTNQRVEVGEGVVETFDQLYFIINLGSHNFQNFEGPSEMLFQHAGRQTSSLKI